jgi:hypothetical protein
MVCNRWGPRGDDVAAQFGLGACYRDRWWRLDATRGEQDVRREVSRLGSMIEYAYERPVSCRHGSVAYLRTGSMGRSDATGPSYCSGAQASSVEDTSIAVAEVAVELPIESS